MNKSINNGLKYSVICFVLSTLALFIYGLATEPYNDYTLLPDIIELFIYRSLAPSLGLTIIIFITIIIKAAVKQ